MQFSTLAVTLFVGLAAAAQGGSSKTHGPVVAAPTGTPDESDCDPQQVDTLNQCLQNIENSVSYSKNCLNDDQTMNFTCACLKPREKKTCWDTSCKNGAGLQSVQGDITLNCPRATITPVVSKAVSTTGASKATGTAADSTATGTDSANAAKKTNGAAGALSGSYAIIAAPIVAFFAL